MALGPALEGLLPPFASWERTDATDDISFTTRSARSLPARSLEIRIRGGDVEVCFSIQGVRGSPFEQVLAVRDLGAEEAARIVTDFVTSILEEKIVLVMNRGLIKGGREFVKPEGLGERAPSSIRWTASWNGTYDRGLFGA